MMHSDQVHIDADIVREMIFDQFPEYRHERIVQLGAIGTVNAIFRIGSKRQDSPCAQWSQSSAPICYATKPRP